MKPLSRFNQLFSALALTVASTTLQAQNVELDIERSVKVEFNSQKGYSYNVYGTSDPAKRTGWKLLGGGDGTGESIVFFYRAEADQKVFFKVESEPSEPSEEPKPQEPVQSIVPITSLPPAESSGTYNLVEAIGENEIGGVYRIGISQGTDGVVIELPHPGLQEYRQKQIKLSIYRGGTGLGSGKVSLKVPTLAGDEYESRKLVDNASKQITDEVIILPATGSKDGRKVVVDLFNDTANTDGSAGGQWVVTTAAEAVEPTLAHRWEGTQLTLQKPDGTWGESVNLQGLVGIQGAEGSQGDIGPKGEQGAQGVQGLQGLAGERGLQGSQGISGPIGPKGEKGSPGSVMAEGIDVSALERLTRVAVRGLSGANLSGMDLSGWDLSYANLKDANLEDANLSGADLSEANLWGVDLSGADLSGADLSEAELNWAWLSGATLSGATLSGAILWGVNLSGADLTNADLSGALLSWADLSGANLRDANLEGANLSDAVFNNTTMPDGTIRNEVTPTADYYLLVNTVNPAEQYDTVMVGYKDATSLSLMNDDIDNDPDHGRPQVFSAYADNNYQDIYHFEMSALDLHVRDVPDEGFFRVIISKFEEWLSLGSIAYDQVQSSRPSAVYLDGLRLNFGVVSIVGNTTVLNVNPVRLAHHLILPADQIRDYTIVDIKLNLNKTGVSQIRINNTTWINPDP